MTEKYRSLVSAYQDQVYSLARYLLADASEAEDVAQETYLKLWLNLDRVEHSQAGPWLLKVARNNCLDRLRSRKQQVDLEAEPLVIDQREQPPDKLERVRMQEHLMNVIQTMEEPWRSLLILRDIHEHSYESVGAILELKPSQVKVYLHRARSKLSELMNDFVPAE